MAVFGLQASKISRMSNSRPEGLHPGTVPLPPIRPAEDHASARSVSSRVHFWDKLGALFRYRTKVAFPDDGSSLGRHLP
jgi:hypothetical protein